MKRKAKTPKPRTWAPKLRAVTLEDRRTKRNRTRGDKARSAIREFE